MGIKMISVIVPVFNIEEYIGECIESIISQSYSDLEIILVDDGSTDRSGGICDTYAQKDNRIQVIHKNNGGLVSARKAGLRAAKGKYISYVDGDDWIDSRMYQKLLEMNSTADVIAFAGYEEYGPGRECGYKKNTIEEGLYESGEERFRLYSLMMFNGNFFENGVLTYLWSKLIKRELLMEPQMNVPDEVSYAEDAACIYPCLLKAESVYVSNELLYHYRVRQDSMVKEEIGKEKLQKLFQILGSSFSSHPLKEKLLEQLKHFIRHAMLLKGYKNIRHSMALFPFEKVKMGMKVAVYGAGIFGKIIWNYCKMDDSLITAGWFDLRYDVYASQGLCVQPAGQVMDSDFDVIAIAIANVKLARKIQADFVQKGIPEEKIDLISMEALGEMKLPDYIEI
ncbi:MAG: glycosyltransferase [Lachnospiraceae bacterium]|nr:glycosyltransferase [Lachnospiraceae bacterium]